MISFDTNTVGYATALVIGAGLGVALFSTLGAKRRHKSKSLMAEELNKARREAETIVREAKLAASEQALVLRQEEEKSFTERQAGIHEFEKRLMHREAQILGQVERLELDQKSLAEARDTLTSLRTTLETEQTSLRALTFQRNRELEGIARLNEAEARAQLLREVEQSATREAGEIQRRIVEKAKVEAESEARRILAVAIQRYAGSHSFETTTATVSLTGDDMKGRIIGREGRNIRAFEAATGVTVLIDDTPNAVVLSGFDPVRREIAREAMHRLIQDGRIHPTRIEEVVAQVTLEIQKNIMLAGEEAIFKLGLAPMQPEVVKRLGALKFRFSFSQNILAHSIEVAYLCGLMAAEMGLDPQPAKRAGLLHDIGKALNHEIEGAHAIIGADLVRRNGESAEVVNAVASHHDEVPHIGVLGILVSAADAISASRPGARAETMTTYIQRLERLEQIGSSFEGVEKSFAIQAGRELRVIVQPGIVTDEQANALARNIVRKIEEELQYPGQIRVTVVRETRCVEYAK